MTEKQRANEQIKQFLMAAKSGDVNTLETLLAANPQLIGKCDKELNTGLHLAIAQFQKGSVVVCLIAKNADLKATNKNGRNPIMLSIESTSSVDESSMDGDMVTSAEEILVLLLDAGCSPIVKTGAGYPIHFANQRVLHILLENKDKWLRGEIRSHVVSEIVAPIDAAWTPCDDQLTLIQLIANAVEKDAQPEPEPQPTPQRASSSSSSSAFGEASQRHLQTQRLRERERERMLLLEQQQQQEDERRNLVSMQEMQQLQQQQQQGQEQEQEQGQQPNYQVEQAMDYMEDVDTGFRKATTQLASKNASNKRSEMQLMSAQAMAARDKRIRKNR